MRFLPTYNQECNVMIVHVYYWFKFELKQPIIGGQSDDLPLMINNDGCLKIR